MKRIWCVTRSGGIVMISSAVAPGRARGGCTLGPLLQEELKFRARELEYDRVTLRRAEEFEREIGTAKMPAKIYGRVSVWAKRNTQFARETVAETERVVATLEALVGVPG